MDRQKEEYEQLFQAVPCGILQLKMPIADLCHIVKMNRRAVEILNLSAEQLESKTLWVPDHMDGQNRKNASVVLSQLKYSGDQGTFLIQLYQGTVQGEAQIIENSDGKLLQLIFMEIGKEIAVRRREAEQAELLESVLQSVRCGVVRYGFCDDEQKIILVNQTGWEMLGFDSELQCKEKGMNGFLPRVHPDDRKILLRTHCTLKEKNGKNSCEFRLYAQTGEIRWISVEEQQLRDVHGNDIIQMTMTDVTVQKQQMEQKEAENGEIIQSLGMMYFLILYIDVDHDSYRVIKSDFPLLEQTTCSYSQIMKDEIAIRCGQNTEEGQRAEEYRFLLSLEQFKKRYEKKIQLWEHDFLAGEKDDLRYYRVETLLSGSKNNLHHIVMALRNVTKLRKKEMREREALQSAYEAATQANCAKTEFLSRMSHDIRTPMNAIMGLTQLMRNYTRDSVKIEEYLDKINASSQLLLELINDVLDMSRVESGKLVLQEQTMDLNDLIEKIQVIIQPEMQRHRHTFHIKNQLPHQLVRGDTLRLQQIILNILSNCAKFTPDGGKIEWILWTKKTQNNKYQNTYMCITDTGIGMSEEFLERIYQPFEREERFNTQIVQGSGLGMTIVRNLVQLMNGWIKIRSTVGEGSGFQIMLPLLVEEQDKKSEQTIETKNSYEKPNLTGKRILLTEDNKINMLIASELLKKTGADIEQAVNGQEAVECFRMHDIGYYDLIFMDIRMPILNGYEAVKEIRRSDRIDAKKVPIIAMTANAFAEDIQEALSVGMNDHLAKPVQVGLLYQILHKYIGAQEKGGQQ